MKIGGLNYQITATTGGFSRSMVSTRSDIALTKRLMRESKPAAEVMAEGLQRIERLFKSGQIDARAYRFALNSVQREQREMAAQQRGNIPVVGQLHSMFSSLTPAMMASAAAGAVFAAGMQGLRSVVASVREQMGMLDDVAKGAETLQMGGNQLMRLRFAAEQSDVDIAKLDSGLAKMVRSVGQAAQGLGEARLSLAQLGIDARSLNQLSPEKQFQMIAEALRGVTNNNDRLRMTMDIFGRGGGDLLRMLNLGEAGLQRLGSQIKTFSDEQLQGVEDANDAWNRLTHSTNALSQTLAVELAPALETTYDKIRVLVESDALAIYFGNAAQSSEDWVTSLMRIAPELQAWDYLLGNVNAVADRSLELDRQLAARETRAPKLNVPSEDEIEAAAAAAEAAKQADREQQDADRRRKESVTDVITALGEQVFWWGKTAEQIEYAKAAAAGASAEELYNIRMLQVERQRRQAEATRGEAIRRSTEDLREQLDVLRYGADAVERWKLQQQGVGEAQLNQLDTMRAERDALQLRQRLVEQFKANNRQTGKPQLAQAYVRGSAADLDFQRQLAANRTGPQELTNQHLAAAVNRLDQLVTAAERSNSPTERRRLEAMVDLLEKLLDKEITVDEVRL